MENGSRTSREVLIKELIRNRKMLLCKALKIVGSKDAAEDVLQDTAMKCLMAPPSTLPNALPGYVSRMVRNAAVDYLRKHKREIPDPFENDQKLALAGMEQRGGYRTLAAKQQTSQLAQAMRELPARSQEVFIRHRLGGVAQNQLAKEYEVSPTLINFIIKDADRSCRSRLETAA